jgi:hypothetical protein
MKTRTRILNQLLAGAVFLFLFSCKKSAIEHQADTVSTGKQISALVNPTVYVAGTINNQAGYWKDGVWTALSGGIGASGVAIDANGNVHVCGYRSNAFGDYEALYWFNGGTPTLLPGTGSGDMMSTEIVISPVNGDVYIAGYGGRYATDAVYWKNGVLNNLGAGRANSIFVAANGDVYVPNYQAASYWKNGSVVNLPYTGASFARVNAVVEQGGNVYAVGSQSGSPQIGELVLYWKNGVLQNMMTGGNLRTVAWDIAVSATGQANIAGYTELNNSSNQRIGYWNTIGDLSTLGTNTLGQPRIALDGTDVYISGSEWVNAGTTSVAKYWRNGGAYVLTNGLSLALAADIAVVYP